MKNFNPVYNTDLKKLKKMMDKIITDLSNETNPQNLHCVAKELLDLHRFIDIMNLNHNYSNLKENQNQTNENKPTHKVKKKSKNDIK